MEDLYTRTKLEIMADIRRLEPPEKFERPAEKEKPDPCLKCRWKTPGRPCVMPEGVCRL